MFRHQLLVLLTSVVVCGVSASAAAQPAAPASQPASSSRPASASSRPASASSQPASASSQPASASSQPATASRPIAPISKPPEVPPKVVPQRPATQPAVVVGGAVPRTKAQRKAKLKKSFLRGRELQEEPLSTDRPGNTESATTVAVLHLQVETSVLWQKSKVDGLARNMFRFPTALRLGVLDRLELRLRGDLGVIETREGQDTAKGAADLVFGLRARLLDGRDHYVPALAVQLELGIPSGSGQFTSKAVNPELQVNTTFGLPAGFWLALNTSVDMPNDVVRDDLFWRWNGAAQLGYRPAAFDRLAAFVDIAAGLPFDRELAAFDQVYFSGGLSCRINHDAQVDVYAQTGLTQASADLGIGVGFAYRL